MSSSQLLNHGRQLRIPRAADIIANELRQQIVRGEVTVGQVLPSETELMSLFGVSRPTLREAVRILETEGLLAVARGAKGGAVVQRLSVGTVSRSFGLLLQFEKTSVGDIYRAHALIEPAAARAVAERGSPDAASTLRACVESGREHLDNDFLFGTDTARFRTQLIELAGIPTLSIMTSMLDNIFERCWATLAVASGYKQDNSHAKQLGIRSFEKLIEFIEARDGTGAEEHWRQHTASVEQSMLRILEAAKIVDILDDY